MENLNLAPITMNFSPLLTVKEVARILRVDDTTVIRWVKGGALEAWKTPGGAYRIRQEAINKLLQAN